MSGPVGCHPRRDCARLKAKFKVSDEVCRPFVRVLKFVTRVLRLNLDPFLATGPNRILESPSVRSETFVTVCSPLSLGQLPVNPEQRVSEFLRYFKARAEQDTSQLDPYSLLAH